MNFADVNNYIGVLADARLRQLYFPPEYIKKLDAKAKEVIVGKDITYNYYLEYEKKRKFRERVGKSLKPFKEKKAQAKAVNPDKVTRRINRPKKADPSTIHKVITEELFGGTQPLKATLSAKTKRASDRRKAREHLSKNNVVLPSGDTLKERIERRAYQHWEASGRVGGRDVEHWATAKKEFITETAQEIYRSRQRIESRKKYRATTSGSAETDWIKAEDTIERGLKDPQYYARLETKYAAKNKRTFAAIERRAQRLDYIDKINKSQQPISTIGKDIGKGIRNIMSFTHGFFKESNFARNTKLFFTKNRWARGAAKGLAGTLAVNLGLGLVRKMFAKPAIPSEYEKGYDIITNYSTDFGSPLKLSKSAHKALRPYYSTVRRGLRTNTSTVISNNISLLLSKNAIGHTRY